MPMGTASTTTETAIQNEPTIPCEMPARLADDDRPASRKLQPRSPYTGMPSVTTVAMSTPRISIETSRQAISAASNARPRTSAREPRRARATEASTAPPVLDEMVVRDISASADLVRLAHAAHEAVGDHVQAQRQEEQDDADEVEAGHRQVGAPHPLGARRQRRHRRRHGEAAVERVGGEGRRVRGPTGDEHHHRLADGPARMASSDTDAMSGMVRMPTPMPAASIEPVRPSRSPKKKPTTSGAIQLRANTPSTTDGMPASTSSTGLSTARTRGRAYSDR